MRATVITHPEAKQELREAGRYYHDCAPGLGQRFYDEIEAFVEKITANPLRYSIRIADVRRANLKRFPFHINFLIHEGMIAIVAISHNRRRPYYWRDRIEHRTWLDV